MQGLSSSFLAKIFPKLEKAGIVHATEGMRGGYRLARAPADITVLDIVDAIEGAKPLFECQEIRGRCAVFAGSAPKWATKGRCSIHATMLRAEKAMRDSLAEETLATLAEKVDRKAPKDFADAICEWLSGRAQGRATRRSSPGTKGIPR